jgi:hypothetical protein
LHFEKAKAWNQVFTSQVSRVETRRFRAMGQLVQPHLEDGHAIEGVRVQVVEDVLAVAIQVKFESEFWNQEITFQGLKPQGLKLGAFKLRVNYIQLVQPHLEQRQHVGEQDGRVCDVANDQRRVVAVQVEFGKQRLETRFSLHMRKGWKQAVSSYGSQLDLTCKASPTASGPAIITFMILSYLAQSGSASV